MITGHYSKGSLVQKVTGPNPDPNPSPNPNVVGDLRNKETLNIFEHVRTCSKAVLQFGLVTLRTSDPPPRLLCLLLLLLFF